MRPAALALAVLAAGCVRVLPASAPPAAPRYVVGEAYELGRLWSYPREDFALAEGGLASVLPDTAAGRRTANGEVFDPAQLMAAHRTLQLPAIVTVTALETGRELAVRVNDRGPTRPGRVIGLSRRAAELLGLPPGGAAQVRIAVDGMASRALAAALGGGTGPALAIAAAPRAVVQAEALAPPPGARGTAGRPAPETRTFVEAPASAPPPERLPERVASVLPAPGALLLEAGTFFRRDLAARQAARLAGLGARVEPFGTGARQQQFRVRAGPFPDVATADRALAAALDAGLPDPRLLVE